MGKEYPSRKRYDQRPDVKAKKLRNINQRNAERRIDLLKRDGDQCGICGKPLGNLHNATVHVDHILPKSKGGSDEMSNLQLTHAWCNSSLNNKDKGIGQEDKQLSLNL